MEKCVNCQYYDRRNARANDGRAPVMWGQCRRHSPDLSPNLPGAQKSYAVEGVWPLVRDDDWCGEWQAPARVSAPRARFVPKPVDVATDAPSDPIPAEAEQQPVTIAAADARHY